MQTQTRPMVTMKGAPAAVITSGDLVEVWVSSPTGDSSDTHIFTIPCMNKDQAEAVAEMWLNAWGLNGEVRK